MTGGLLVLTRFLIILFLLFSTALWGCGGMKTAPTHPAAPPEVKGRFRAGQIVDLAAKTRISFDELVQSLAAKDVVFIGEIHDNAGHHLIQIQLLQALLSRWGSNAAMAMEFFPRPAQEFLDGYVKGRLTEREFLEAVDWEKTWGYDYGFYRPLLLEARERSIRVLAINAPSAIVRKVAREGFASLTGSESAQIARNLDLSQTAHREMLQKVYGQHAHADLKDFERFYEAQVVWEETMAETIAEHLQRNGGKVVVFTGNGHIIHKFGVPDRTAKRVQASLATVVPYPLAGEGEVENGLADFVWFTPGHPQKSHWTDEQVRPSPRM